MKYRYLLVDNDNTLMDFNLAEKYALEETLVNAGLPVDNDTVSAYHRINDALWKALERGETTQAELKVERFAQLLEYLTLPRDTAAELGAAYAENLGNHADLLPGAMNFIENMHGEVKIALVSNGISRIQRHRLSLCPFTPLLDAIVISEEIGVSKPDPAMIDKALEMLGCTDKREAVMLGDSHSADIGAAVNAGVDSIWLNPDGKVSDKATYSVKTLEEAAAIIGGQHQ